MTLRTGREQTRRRTGEAVALFVRQLSEMMEARSARFARLVLIGVCVLATALSLQGFVFGPLENVDLDMATARWVYLGLGALFALALAAFEHCRRLRIYLFALATLAFGLSFVLLDYHVELGYRIVVGTVAASGLIAVIEFYGGRAALGDS